MFWQDSWQQWPALNAEDWACDICAQAIRTGLTRVADYWQENPTEDTWRCWHLDRERLNLREHVDLAPLQTELTKRRIPVRAGEDTLRWGYRPQGSFSVREAYQITAHSNPPSDSDVWRKIWKLKHWPKITLFLWLVSHSSILTWDNLLKRGFVGPSLCILCGAAEENMNHLLNTCPYTAQIWDQAATIMRTSDRLRDSIIATITNWREQAFQSPLLNRIWQLLPGFILWQTWKERNRRIFRNTSLTWQHCWDHCFRNILETLRLRNWTDADTACPPSELTILRYWTPLPTLQIRPLPPSSQCTSNSPSFWSPPPEGFVKLNFDGASKGNPGAAGYGVVYRNHHGHILEIMAGSLGHSTNNVAELWGLIKGLQLAIKSNYTKVIVEGDSQVIIGLLRRILNGAKPDSISPSWRLSHGLQITADLLNPNHVFIPAHIKRKANQVVDELANLGANRRELDLHCHAAQDQNHPILQQCIRKAGMIDNSPDGVSDRSTWQEMREGRGRRGMEPRDGLVPQPITPPEV
jgi:ribonuclease HI